MRLSKAFGQNVRQLRKKKGLSIEALADDVRVATTYVGQLERGQRNPTLAMVEKFAEVLGAEPLDLLKTPVVEPDPKA
jgi:transcriptional regulator with XRE-family HTH domain